jgi:hypothetical protein
LASGKGAVVSQQDDDSSESSPSSKPPDPRDRPELVLIALAVLALLGLMAAVTLVVALTTGAGGFVGETLAAAVLACVTAVAVVARRRWDRSQEEGEDHRDQEGKGQAQDSADQKRP